MIKTIAFYLPQFYTFPENDEWWGKGFTEWTNVKKAKPLFWGHQMPEVPYNNNYYDLSNVDNMIWQSKLAMKYGVDGFCYYHYWFKNGKKLLEIPVENMLNNEEVEIPFCLCWANEAWARTWDGNEADVLMPQEYDEDIDSLKKHFYYLLPFFKDKRYIKEHNKPLFIIYKPYLIQDINKLMECWNELAIQEGFNGIFWGVQHTDNFKYTKLMDKFDLPIEFEPSYTANHEMRILSDKSAKRCSFIGAVYKVKRMFMKFLHISFKFPLINSYDETWGWINKRVPERKNTAPGAFVAWDNTPRKGRKGIVYHKPSPEKFKNYMIERYKRTKTIYNSDYLFINAWNEWAEGAHLEPTEKKEYAYLIALKEAQEATNVKQG